MKYAVLTFNFGKYETIKEPLEISQNAEYVLVTDDKTIKSDKWTIKYLPSYLDDATPFTKAFYVRYHPFEFVNADLVTILDGSIQIKKSLDKFINDFIDSNSDICLGLNTLANPFDDEYNWFINTRGYNKVQAEKNKAMTKLLGYTKDYKGYFEAGYKICKRSILTDAINEMTWRCLLKISNNEKDVDRLDQPIFSAIINFHFSNIKIFKVSRQIIKSKYMMWMQHGTNTPKDTSVTPKKLWFKNTLVDTYQLE